MNARQLLTRTFALPQASGKFEPTRPFHKKLELARLLEKLDSGIFPAAEPTDPTISVFF